MHVGQRFPTYTEGTLILAGVLVKSCHDIPSDHVSHTYEYDTTDPVLRQYISKCVCTALGHYCE